MNKPRYKVVYSYKVNYDEIFDVSKLGVEIVATMQEVNEWIEIIKSVRWEDYKVFDLITDTVIKEANNLVCYK